VAVARARVLREYAGRRKIRRTHEDREGSADERLDLDSFVEVTGVATKSDFPLRKSETVVLWTIAD
jgi:hypothetical protein